ncbi:hypothetical protein, conserved [Trypanosoma brucei gambiense DAL972]|uniref:Protein kinase domain-containing protein n=1 Tax=Trypanosoma brucei gambiense (strain MHOM/CI/86/DAL972) TaxID=679716 RepID=D0A3X2_TRYB9|nr:hypothetical protein, conserved [Trypanosoma brucei gambiense DAL972]CBH15966.1 hypothetical protein, conserved [Trypanosoma brucei gambiense DAL972]|eukprot:XP_011778230.1 hypothetical protein, conserved [Trypanosoma brucei gambiense DAL972]
MLRRIWSHKVLTTFVTLPVASVGGIAIYVEYRQRTRPVLPVFAPVVDGNGSLLLDGKTVPKPSRWVVARRVVELFLIFFPVAVLYVVMRLRRDWYLLWLQLLLRAVERAGPAFVKAGQWSCTRQDVFSPEFRSVFKKLYDEVDTHPYEVSLQILREELQQDPAEIFSTIEEKTVGSGSIGQVHSATLRHTGEHVVVKVMHPNVVETIVKDFCIINTLASFLHHRVPALEKYDLPALAIAWTTHLAAQLDFRLEARNLTLFRKNFRNEPYVRFPKPLLSTQRVLVETFCKGEPASVEFLAAQEEHARDKIANMGLNTWCKMLLHDKFLHGDMHPGNVIIDASDPHEPCVWLIDAGLCQQISEDEGVITHNLMEAFVHWKADLCCDALLSMGKRQKYADENKFRSDMNWLFNHWRPLHSKDAVVTNILQAIFECVRVNQVHMDPPYVSLLFAVLVLESFIMNLNPEFNMVRHAAPWLVADGHLTRGLMKNIVMTRLDLIKREMGVLRGRLRDGAHNDLAKNENVHLNANAW